MSRWLRQRIEQMLLCMVCLLRLLILVFVALTQHCIQSTMGCENSTLYQVASCPFKGVRLLYCAFHLVGLAVYQSEEAALLTFLELSTTREIAGKMHSQSPILKTKGALRNPVILRYLWEQSCILHTLTKLPA